MPYSTFLTITAEAMSSTGEIAWLQNAYTNAVNAAIKARKTGISLVLEVCLARLYVDYDAKEDEAIEIWRRILLHPDASYSGENVLVKFCKTSINLSYGVHLHQKALRAGDGKAEADGYIEELKTLYRRTVKQFGKSSELVLGNKSALLVGLWHYQHGRVDEAMIYLQPYLREQLALLSDDDPENDTDPTGDTNDQQKHTDAINRTPAEEYMASARVASDKDWVLYCDGVCGRRFGNWVDSYICCRCTLGLCADCVERARGGEKLKSNIYCPEHQWLHIPPPEQVAKPGEIFTDGKMITISEFCDSLRKRWL
ncbi:hypothetical protein AJ79_06947 [Helicocarpus griseus UAMH5409]|uniref:Uncharacterized protein n=1 Tax=Helicocarpus griseus UAMH5409 TaxID=1447875 RepID=A0A2B7X7Z9_9EURO|nr:hypothetical protein AJ79_06947 [Helicocarpus griseus UAMH5409]